MKISDLGGTRPPNSVILQPSATIFNLAMTVVGVLIVAGSWFVQRALGRRSVTIPIAVLGVGALGVGLFPGTPATLMRSSRWSRSSRVGSLLSARPDVATAPFRYISFLLGAASLATLGTYMLLGDASPMAMLGIGGVERWIVYPVVLWITAFGGYLCGRADGGPDEGLETGRR